MKSSIIQKLQDQLKKICKERGIIDIVLFGSVVKAKENPQDIDIAIILEKEDYNEAQRIIKKIKKEITQEIHPEILFVKNLFREPLYLTLIHEGFSIKQRNYVAKTLKTKSLMLITYDLRNLSHSKKTLFGYALKGRKGQEGFLKSIKGEPVGRNNVIVPTEKEQELQAFMKTWNVKTKSQRFLKVDTII